ncbi:MAG: DUF881 domain-containing protein [Bacillota bacterium]
MRTEIWARVALVALCLGILLGVEIRTAREVREMEAKSQVRYRSMLQLLEKAQTRHRELVKEVKKLKKRISDFERGAVVSARTREMLDATEKARMLAGEKAVEGPGIVIQIDDRQGATTIIYSGDLQDFINILRFAGAEAIAVNGQRIVGTTAVHEAGQNLLINKVPVNRREGVPYEIMAIGPPDRLESYIKTTYGLWKDLEAAGVRLTLTRQERLLLPAYKGGYLFRYGIAF